MKKIKLKLFLVFILIINFLLCTILILNKNEIKNILGKDLYKKEQETEVIYIGTAEELATFRDEVNSGSNTGATVYLTDNIDLSSYSNWTPITGFAGVFDGNGYYITNVTIDSTENGIGFFKYSSNTTIKNLGIINSNIKGGDYVGGLVGSNGASSGTIQNCYISDSTVIGNDYVGGIVGAYSRLKISGCYNKATIIGNEYIGGIVSYADEGNLIDYCYNKGNVSGESYVGGITGCQSSPTFKYCYNIGSVSGTSNVGSIAGWWDAENYCVNNYYLNTCTEDEYATAVTEEYMKTNSFIEDLGGSNYWKLETNMNSGYPILVWEEESQEVKIYLDIDTKDGIQYLIGDVDGDSDLTAADSSIILQKVLDSAYEGEYLNFLAADVDGDGIITQDDSDIILSKVLDVSIIMPAQYKESICIIEGETLNLKAEYEGNSGFKWSSKDNTIVTINETSGEITGIKEGNTYITVTEQGSNKTKTIPVKVNKKVRIYADKNKLEINGTEYLIGDVDGDGVIAQNDIVITLRKVQDSTADVGDFIEEVADVDGDGVLTTYDVSCIAQKVSDESYIFPILYITEKTIKKGDTLQLNAEILRNEDNNMTITSWSSSDEDIVSVDESGKITAIEQGEATITVTAENETTTTTSNITITVTNNIDETAPIISGVVNNKWYKTDVTATVTENEGTLNSDGLQYYYSESPITETLTISDMEGTSADTYSLTFTEEGYYCVVAIDEAGNKSDFVYFQIDKTAPIISGVVNNKWYKTDVTATVTENEGTLNSDGLQYYYSESPITETLTISDMEGTSADTYSLTFTEEGYYCVVAIDEAGNKSDFVYFQIDKTAPTTTPPTATATSNSIIVTCQQTDEGSGIDTDSIEYFIREQGETEWSDSQYENEFTGLTPNTTYEVKTTVADNVINPSESEVFEITTAKASITGIEITKTPDKTSYVKGEDLDLTGGQITATYEDGTTQIISMLDDSVGYSGYNANTLGEQTITITYAGKTATYKVTVYEDEYFIVNTYEKDDENLYITKILPETTFSEFKEYIETNMTYIIKENNEEIEDATLIKTGQELIVTNREGIETTYKLVVIGDINKDGKIGMTDLNKLKRYSIKKESLEDIQIKAGDMNFDDESEITDISIMQRYIIGKIKTLI